MYFQFQWQKNILVDTIRLYGALTGEVNLLQQLKGSYTEGEAGIEWYIIKKQDENVIIKVYSFTYRYEQENAKDNCSQNWTNTNI